VALPVNAAPAFNFNDTFESATTKGVVNQSSLSSFNSGETFGMVYAEGSVYYAYYENRSDGKIYVRNSTDKLTWGDPTLVLGKYGGSWQASKVYCPIVWKEGSTYYMIYTGLDSDSVGSVGLATSDLPDRNYTRYSTTTPIYQNVYPNNWSYVGAEAWGIQKISGTYYLWVNNFGGYGAAPTGTGERQLGLITSTDLHTWTADPNNPIFVGQRFCPWMFKVGGYYYLIVTHQYDGTDYAVFELYRDVAPTFYEASREYMGNVLNTPRNTLAFDGVDMDTPALISSDVSFDITENPLQFYYAIYNSSGWRMGSFNLSQSELTNRTLLADVYNTQNNQTANITLDTTVKHNGASSLKFGLSPTVGYTYRIFPNAISGNTSFWIYQSTGTTGSDLTVRFYDDRNTELIYFKSNVSRYFGYKNGSTLYSGSLARSASIWYKVVIDYNTTSEKWGYNVINTTEDLVLESKSDLDFETSGDKVNSIAFYKTTATNNPLYYIDDLQLNGDAIAAVPPVSLFSKNVSSGVAPLSVAFTDTSTNSPTLWNWSFGDGNWSNGTTQNATHTYDFVGTFNSFLIASNAAGNDQSANQTIAIYDPVVADFTATASGNTVTFADLSTGTPTSWVWQYNQHETPGWVQFSTAQNPSYNFVAGTYDINLTATNAAGSDSEVKISFIVTTAGDSGTVFPDTPSDLEAAKARYKANYSTDYAVMSLLWLIPMLIGVALALAAFTGKQTDYTLLMAGVISITIGMIILVVIFGLMSTVGGVMD